MTLWLFIHLLGFTAWIGGGLASMVTAIAARGEDRAALGAVVRTQAVVHKLVIGPGALLSVLSGLILSFRLSSVVYSGANTWLIIMQGTGILGALIVLFVSLPTVSRLARVNPVGEHAAYFDELRNRHRLLGTVAGVLAMIALVAGAVLRYGG